MNDMFKIKSKIKNYIQQEIKLTLQKEKEAVPIGGISVSKNEMW